MSCLSLCGSHWNILEHPPRFPIFHDLRTMVTARTLHSGLLALPRSKDATNGAENHGDFVSRRPGLRSPSRRSLAALCLAWPGAAPPVHRSDDSCAAARRLHSKWCQSQHKRCLKWSPGRKTILNCVRFLLLFQVFSLRSGESLVWFGVRRVSLLSGFGWVQKCETPLELKLQSMGQLAFRQP